MPIISRTSLCVLLATCFMSAQIRAQGAETIIQQWKTGLSGALLTAYSGSITSNHSSLTTLRLCQSGRYSYLIDAGWSIPGQAGGASNSTVTGNWSVIAMGPQVFLEYQSDQGEGGRFYLYLQADGKVNIGGTPFSVQRGGAGC